MSMPHSRATGSFAAGLIVGAAIAYVLGAQVSAHRSDSPIRPSVEEADRERRPTAEGTGSAVAGEGSGQGEAERLRAQVSSMKSTLEERAPEMAALRSRISSLEFDLRAREMTVKWLEKELLWITAGETQHRGLFPEDDPALVHRLREDFHYDFEGRLELTPKEIHDLLPAYAAFLQDMEDRPDDREVRKQHLRDRSRRLAQEAEKILPPDKAAMVRERFVW